jgi:beta-lactamase superfamily II metal-dependent hydrolase
MTDLVVRLYDVRFGDAILVSIPDSENGHPVERTILFDFGNALGTEGGPDTALDPVVADILERLDGRPLDLYVMTHEHLDHVQGALYASQRLGKDLKAKQVWLTGSADPAYYATHPDARKQRIAALAAFDAAVRRLEGLEVSPFLEVLMANNNPSKTGDCVRYLREQVAAPADVHFVDRTTDLAPFHPDLGDATVTLWAPEEDTADYYGSFHGLVAGLGIDDTFELDDVAGKRLASEPDPIPPAGVDAGAFYKLLDVRHGAAATLLSIDRAANNTSVVTLLEWNGWRLLFTGDAEQRSWRTMESRVGIGPVHFLKVSHHGSHTGMPPDDVLARLIPSPPPGGHRARAAVSTYPNTYPGVPDKDTLDALKARLDLRSTRDLAAGELFLEYRFKASGPPA